MMIKKHFLKAVLAIAILAGANIASAVNINTLFNASRVKVSASSMIGVVSPVSGSYRGNDTIPVTIETKNPAGPIYLYLFDPALRRVVATESFPKSALSLNSQSVLRFNLAKSKASNVIKPGVYRIAVCDMGVKSLEPACALSGAITITPSIPVIISVDPATLYTGTSALIYGSGFDTDSYVLIDGGWNSLATLQILGDDSAKLSLLPGLRAGAHTIQIVKRGLGASSAVSINVLDARAPFISGVSKSGPTYTVTGTGFSRAYPSRIEALRNGQRVTIFDPSLRNGYAISSDGMSLRFQLESNIDTSGLSIRIINSEYLISNIVSLR
jgi:hypothetical protein